MDRKLEKFTVHQAADKLAVSEDEIRRAIYGLKLHRRETMHLDEKQVFEISKWLHRNSKTGLTDEEAATQLGLDLRDIRAARHAIWPRGIKFIPDDALIQIRNWIRKNRQS